MNTKKKTKSVEKNQMDIAVKMIKKKFKVYISPEGKIKLSKEFIKKFKCSESSTLWYYLVRGNQEIKKEGFKYLK